MLTAADDAGFDVLLTTDRNMQYQQTMAGRRIAVVALGKGRWSLIEPRIAEICAAIDAAQPGTFTEVPIDFPPHPSNL